MPLRMLLAVSDRPCAHAALYALQPLSDEVGRELVVLGIVQPFRTVYAHKHPLIGRRIRNLLWQVKSEQASEVEQLVRETAATFKSFGWDVRPEVCEGPIVEEVLRCAQAVCPSMLIIGSCLRDALPLWPQREIWREVVRKAACPVLVVKHAEIGPSPDPGERQVVEEVNDWNELRRKVSVGCENRSIARKLRTDEVTACGAP